MARCPRCRYLYLSRQSERGSPGKLSRASDFPFGNRAGFQGKSGPCLGFNQAIIYRGPFKKVEADDGHVFSRGEGMAVCDKTFNLLQSERHQGLFDAVEPLNDVPFDDATTFDFRRARHRNPRATNCVDDNETSEIQAGCCGPDEACC